MVLEYHLLLKVLSVGDDLTVLWRFFLEVHTRGEPLPHQAVRSRLSLQPCLQWVLICLFLYRLESAPFWNSASRFLCFAKRFNSALVAPAIGVDEVPGSTGVKF